MNAWRAVLTFSSVILQVGDSGFGPEQQEQGRAGLLCRGSSEPWSAVLVSSLPQFSHVGFFFSSVSLFAFLER